MFQRLCTKVQKGREGWARDQDVSLLKHSVNAIEIFVFLLVFTLIVCYPRKVNLKYHVLSRLH